MTRNRKTNDRPMIAFPLDRFTWSKEEAALVADASDLCPVGSNHFVQPLYFDACDVGIEIKSPSGRAVRFVLDESRDRDMGPAHDAEGEVRYWQYMPAPGNEDQPIKRVTIFND